MTINILTPEYKKNIEREMRKRSVVIIMLVGMALVLCAGILFSGLYMYARVNYSIAEASLQSLLTQDENQEYRDITKRIRGVNTITKKASLAFHQMQLSHIVSSLQDQTAQEITLQEIRVVSAQEDAPGSLFVRGIANTREDLLFFVQALKNNPLFVDVIVPVSHFVAGTDVTFSLSATLAELQ
jgi:hypothetical protein